MILTRIESLGHTRLLRLIVMMGVMMFALGYSWLILHFGIQTTTPWVVMGLVLAVEGLAFLIVYPLSGFIFMIIGAMIVPFSISTGSQTNINAAILLVVGILFVWLIEIIVLRRRSSFVWSRPMFPLLIFSVIVLFSLGFGQVPWYPVAGAPIAAQVGGAATFWLSFLLFIETANRIKTLRGLSAIVLVFCVLGGIYIISRVIPILGSTLGILFQYRATSGGGLFWTWIIAMAVSQAVINDRLHPMLRGLALLLTGLTLYVGVVISQEWSSGWLPSLIALAVIVVLYRPRSAFLIVAAGIVLIILKWESVNAILLGGDNAYSLLTRADAWSILGQVIKPNPIFGLGPSNYYFYVTLFPIEGYYVQFNSHNNYVDLVAQVGLVGLAVYLWFMVEVGLLGLKLTNRAAAGFEKAYVYGAIGGLAGTLVSGMLGDWVIPFVYNIGLEGFRSSMLAWLFLGGLVVIENQVRQRTQEGLEAV
jgi:hypothetical protein